MANKYRIVSQNLQKAPGAKFLKLLRKIFARLLFQRKYADFRNFFEKCLWKNL